MEKRGKSGFCFLHYKANLSSTCNLYFFFSVFLYFSSSSTTQWWSSSCPEDIWCSHDLPPISEPFLRKCFGELIHNNRVEKVGAS